MSATTLRCPARPRDGCGFYWTRACPKRRLVEAGFDVVWSGDWPSDPGDDDLLAYALQEDRVLVTLDKDFGELIVLKRRPHAGVMRLSGFGASEQPEVCLQALERYRKDLQDRALITVDRRRVRIRPGERAE